MRIGSFDLFESETSQLGVITEHGLPIGEGPNNPIVWTAAPTNGQVLIGSTGNDPVLNTLTPGAGIAISNGAGTITIAAVAPGMVNWILISASQTLAGNFGYICVGGGNLQLTLPIGSLGDVIEVTLDGSAGWTILTAGQMVRYGNDLIAASLASSAQGDSIRMVCQSASRWNILSSIGNIITI